MEYVDMDVYYLGEILSKTDVNCIFSRSEQDKSKNNTFYRVGEEPHWKLDSTSPIKYPQDFVARRISEALNYGAVVYYHEGERLVHLPVESCAFFRNMKQSLYDWSFPFDWFKEIERLESMILLIEKNKTFKSVSWIACAEHYKLTIQLMLSLLSSQLLDTRILTGIMQRNIDSNSSTETAIT